MITYLKNKILVFLVEDSDFFTKLLLKRFEQEVQVSIEAFSNGESMLKNLHKQPDIIVLDYYLNSVSEDVKNGDEILEMLQEQAPEIPVIILSSQQDVEKAVRMLKIGAVDYIVKEPGHFYDTLIKSIRNIMRVKELETELAIEQMKSKKEKNRLLLVFSLLFVIFIGLLLLNFFM